MVRIAQLAVLPLSLLPLISDAYRRDELPGWQGEESRLGEDNEKYVQECAPQKNTELWGDVVKWGTENLQDSASQCCEECRAHNQAVGTGMKLCNTWVWCANINGCGEQRRFRECWLKHQDDPADSTVQAKGDNVGWTSGALLTAAEAAAKHAKETLEQEAYIVRRTNQMNPHVFFDIEINGKPAGRIEFVLYAEAAPRAAENFRALCTGEKGVVPAGREGQGKPYHFKSKVFYRIIDQFIDQAGAGTESVFGGTFDDDQGGLQIKHDRPGLLSMANSGPNSNTSHFSILVNAAPHLNGKYTVFGEITSGLDVAFEINKLANKEKDTVPLGKAVIADCGQLFR